MSLNTRTTNDYSPLRAPIRDAYGRDMRPQKERQKYEQAVNARREMLNVLASAPQQKLSKKAYERLRGIHTPMNFDPELTPEQRRKTQLHSESCTRATLKALLRGTALVESEPEA